MLARLLAIALLSVAAVASLRAQPQKLDGNGDPLPAGAIARMGSVRFLHGDPPHSLAFLPDGQTLMAAGQEPFVRVWNVADGREVRRFRAASRIPGAALSPDGKTIAGCDVATILLWDASTGKELRRLSGLNRRALQAVWSPKCDWLAASNDQGVIVFWDSNTGAELKRIDAHKGVIRALALSLDGRSLASAGQDQTMRIWDVDKGQELRRLEGETGFQAALAWSPDGKTVAGTCEIRSAAGSRSSLRIWDAATGKMLQEVPGSFNGVAYSPDGKTLVAGALAELRLIDPATGKELRRLPGHYQHVMSLAFSRDGSMLATSGLECRIRLWETKTWTEIRPVPGHSGPVQAIAYGTDGRTIISGGLDQSIRFWDWPANREIRKVDGLGTHWGILALARSPDGKKLISFEQDDSNGPYRVWDTATGKQLARFGERTGGTGAIAFAPDGKRVLTGHWDGSIGVWDAANLKLERRNGKRKGRILAMAGLPDGERAVWAGEYQGSGLRNLSDGKDLHSFAGSPHHIIAGLALSPDGLTLAVAAENNPVRLWSVESGKSRGGWVTEIRYLQAAAYSPDGRLLAVGGHEGVQLWDVLTRQKLPAWKGHDREVKALAFAPDGTTLATAGVDGMVFVWDLTGRLEDGKLVKRKPQPGDMEAAWALIGGDDLQAANRTIWTLVAAEPHSVAWLAARLKPVGKVDKERLTRLIADLDNDAFAAREKAERELAEMAEAAEEALRAALSASPSPEMKRRLQRLLKDFDDASLSGPKLRPLRAVAVLEHIGSRAAKDEIIELAEGQANARLTIEARAALGRLSDTKK